MNALFTADLQSTPDTANSSVRLARAAARVGAADQQITTELIDAFIDRGTVDLIPEFAVPCPSR